MASSSEIRQWVWDNEAARDQRQADADKLSAAIDALKTNITNKKAGYKYYNSLYTQKATYCISKLNGLENTQSAKGYVSNNTATIDDLKTKISSLNDAVVGMTAILNRLSDDYETACDDVDTYNNHLAGLYVQLSAAEEAEAAEAAAAAAAAAE